MAVRHPSGSALSKTYPVAFNSAGQPGQWVVTGRKTENSTVDVLATATCADPVADLTWSTGKATSSTPAGGFLVCKDGRQVVGGGASGKGPDSVLIASRPGLSSQGAVADD
ncbi:hypothetical protein BJP40_14220 [Streptomyces sp. CC53]|uniref:hypothetical protein n=1 Tax=Streptomyces sp. CC53 TaxID=1906740 RepID=UPI0008DE2666|nr:hypothetical protein [Streptomyces sp. CC53]OII66182.1 hypothetical protein BJP40_14220 [Streptomyces sp. CC53]